jgi:PAS domain S-box-containing protein
LDVNDSACRAIGYTRDEMLELTVVDITVGGDHTGYDATNAMVRNAGHATLEVWHRRKDGTTYLAEVSLSSVTLDREYSVAIVRDITSRKQQTDELRRKTAFLEALIGSSRDGIVAVDNNGEKVFQNQRVADLWKIAPEIAGNPDDQVQNLFAMEQIKDPAGFAEKNRRILSQPDELAQDEIELKNGTVLDRQTSPVKDDQGKTHGRVWIFRDVTKSRQLEAHLRQTQKMEAIGTLAGGIAHDFNNILSALLMQVALISMIKSLPGEVRDGLEQIRADTNRAADLTRRLLLFSRRQVMQSRILDLNEVITNLAKMLQRIIGEDVRLQLNLHPVALMTRADAGMIEQVLMNLAVNARDAMPEGGMLNIETAETDVTEQIAVLNPDAGLGRYVSFSVSDAGSGIPPEILPRIFEPFFTTKEAGKGTGLGLATVFGIVKQHLGWIEVDNRPGLGATFRIFLPASTAKEAETTQTTVKPKPRGGSETILLAEDEPRVRESISRILGQRGYKVVSAANAIEALDLWRVHRQQVALLLTDLVMPGGMTGHELARQLRAAQANLKIIFISGYSAEIGGRELQLGNGEVFVQKPFVPDHLLETIRQCLDG